MFSFICSPCRSGADINTKLIANQEHPGSLYFHVVKNRHNECKGGTHCDCQHRVRK